MTVSGAEYLVSAQQAQGVEVVFGYPGGSVLGICDAFSRSSLRFILTRHEQGAVFAADGYARATGKTGVCLATSGPGATNLITGLANAHLDSVPLVAITGQVSACDLGSDAFQEADLFGITLPVTKHGFLVRESGELAQAISEAFHIAGTGRRGPVLVDIPRDVVGAPMGRRAPGSINLPGYQPTETGHPLMMRRGAEALAAAERPLIWAGGGVSASGTGGSVLKLAELLGAPVVTSLMGLGTMPPGHSLSLGMLGMHGHPWANHAVMHCDVLLVLGARFSDRTTGAIATFAPQAKIVQIDIDPAEIGKRRRPTVPIVSDLASSLPALCGLAANLVESDAAAADGLRAGTQAWRAQLAAYRAGCRFPVLEEGRGGLHPARVMMELGRATGGDAIIATDVGQHQMWAAQLLPVGSPRKFLTSGGLGAMGYGIPAALGAQVGAPHATVVAVVGDGGFQMTGNELATIAELGLPVKVLVINNGYLGMVRQWQELFYGGRYFAVAMKGPDFCRLAEAYGIPGARVAEEHGLQDAIDSALRHKGPYLLECVVDPEANVFPIVPAGRGLSDSIDTAGCLEAKTRDAALSAEEPRLLDRHQHLNFDRDALRKR